MTFSRVGNQFRAWRTTGPTHNFLGLCIEGPKPASPRVVRLAASEGRPPSGIDESKLVEAVLEGVERANRLCGTTCHVVEITYVEDDSPRYSEYSILAEVIIRRVASGDPFV